MSLTERTGEDVPDEAPDSEQFRPYAERRKLQPIGSHSVGITLPIDDLRDAGYVDEDGNLVGEGSVVVGIVDEEDGERLLASLDLDS